MTIEFLRHSLEHSSPHRTAQLVECYRDVFADGPWHEWMQCAVCKNYWGTKDYEYLLSENFLHCGVPVIDYWSRHQVIADLRHEITDSSSFWLAIENDKVIGFTWGFPIHLHDLEKKLGVQIANSTIGNISPTDLIAYQDEVGVIASHRSQKIAKALVLHRHRDFLAQGLTFGIVRTREYPEPSDTFLCYTKKLNYQILVRYPDPDGRVVLGRSFTGLEEMLT